jgi:hypothetical protein
MRTPPKLDPEAVKISARRSKEYLTTEYPVPAPKGNVR